MWYRYRLSDGQFLCGMPSRPDWDPTTEGCWDYPRHLRPDIRLHRFDAAAPDKKRLATAEELATFDAERLQQMAVAELDGRKDIKAMVLWVAQKLGIPPATARAEMIEIRKGL